MGQNGPAHFGPQPEWAGPARFPAISISHKETNTNKMPLLSLNRSDHQTEKSSNSNSNQDEELVFVEPNRLREDEELDGLATAQNQWTQWMAIWWDLRSSPTQLNEYFIMEL